MLERRRGDLLVLAVVPVRAVILGEPEYQVAIVEEQVLEHEAPVQAQEIVAHLVEDEVAVARDAAADVDQLDVVEAVRAGHVDQVLADADAAAQGGHLAAGASHVEAEAVKLEAEVAAAADQAHRLFAGVAAEFQPEVGVRYRGVAAEADYYPAEKGEAIEVRYRLETIGFFEPLSGSSSLGIVCV